MDIRKPHEIVPETKIPPRGDDASERWLPLTDEQALQLQGATPDERHAWLKAHVPARERLTRHLYSIGLPTLGALANIGRYSSGRIGLLRDLKLAKRRAVRRKGEHSDKAFAIADLEKLVASGEYDEPSDAEGGA